jgi:hypothetical protein
MILVSGPVIARLNSRTRKWAHEHLRHGSFGLTVTAPNGMLYAELPAVEAHLGTTFDMAQKRSAFAQPA